MYCEIAKRECSSLDAIARRDDAGADGSAVAELLEVCAAEKKGLTPLRLAAVALGNSPAITKCPVPAGEFVRILKEAEATNA